MRTIINAGDSCVTGCEAKRQRIYGNNWRVGLFNDSLPNNPSKLSDNELK